MLPRGGFAAIIARMLGRLIRQLWTRGRRAAPADTRDATRSEAGDADPGGTCLKAGDALKAQGRLAAALEAYRACARAYPEDLRIRGAAANTLSASWCMDQCIAACAEAHALAPENTDVFSGYLLYSHYATVPDAQALAELHQRYGAIAARLFPPRFDFAARDADPERRLRIGYVSRDFCLHSVASFVEPVIAHHDRGRYEVYCYYTRDYRDPMTERFASIADVWRETHADDVRALASRIHADGVDLLVDLGGHTLGNRLLAFAQRPAPVQLTWAGYPDTTGLQTVDYRVTDATVDPPGAADARHSERLLRLPGAFLCYNPPVDSPEVLARPRAGPLVFGSFNMIMKVNEPLLDLWAHILAAVPDSRMMLKSSLIEYSETAQRLLERFTARGIAPDRVELRPWAQVRAAHLDAYNEVDVALDTFPYNGTTTTCEALWMGVPVVTLAGETHMSRVSASLLAAAGLDEYVATTPDDYVRIAVELARDPARRAELARSLRPRLRASPLFDHRGFTHGLEQRYREVWRAWCAARVEPHPA